MQRLIVVSRAVPFAVGHEAAIGEAGGAVHGDFLGAAGAFLGNAAVVGGRASMAAVLKVVGAMVHDARIAGTAHVGHAGMDAVRVVAAGVVKAFGADPPDLRGAIGARFRHALVRVGGAELALLPRGRALGGRTGASAEREKGDGQDGVYFHESSVNLGRPVFGRQSEISTEALRLNSASR